MKQNKQAALRNEPEHNQVPSGPSAPLEEATKPRAPVPEDRRYGSLLERAAVPNPEARAIRDWGINE